MYGRAAELRHALTQGAAPQNAPAAFPESRRSSLVRGGPSRLSTWACLWGISATLSSTPGCLLGVSIGYV